MLRESRFRLVTLGRLTLLRAGGDEDTSLARRRIKLALLAVLAMARRPVARDSLLEMFWGEQDEPRARHSLSNALSSLRRALGQQSITTRDADVALATDTSLAVDALELADAIDARDFARAVELYQGPFLSSVHIDESPTFDQWASRERRRLEMLFVEACSQQCAALARAERWTECRGLAARWVDAEPLSPDAAVLLLTAIKAPGTRAALAQALNEYERIRARLSREFELAPDAAVRELAERTREELAMTDVPASELAAETTVASPPPPPAADRPAAPVSSPNAAPQPRPGGHRRVWLSLATATLIALIAVAMVMRSAGRSAAIATKRKPVIAVLGMDMRSGDSTLAWLGDGLPGIIVGKLAHNEQVDVVPPTQTRAVLVRSGHTDRDTLSDATARDLARRVGATLVARGSVGRDGRNIVLDLTVLDVASGKLVRNDVLTRPDAIALADEAAARILGAANVSVPGPQIAELETSSLEAFQHYMRAIDAGQAGHQRESRNELDAAIALDSGFITALRARMGVAIRDNDTTMMRHLRETMRRHADRATEFDRMQQDVSDALYGGERERSEALARALVRRYPRDPRAYQMLEGVLDSYGRFEDAEKVAVQGLALDSLAMEAGTGPCTPCLGLFDIIGLHWLRSDFSGAADWARRWIRTQPDAPSAWAALAWTYSYMQRPDSALPLMQRAVSLSSDDLWSRDELARMLLVARRYNTADSVISAMEAAATTPDGRESAADLRSLLERERGQFRASNRTMDRLVAASPASFSVAEMTRANNLRSLGAYAEAARKYHSPAHSPTEGRLRLPVPTFSARGFCWRHALAADAYAPTGDTVTLRADADTLERACGNSFYGRDWRLYHHVRGLIAMKGGRYAEAERELAQAVWIQVEGWARITVELARAQAALGRPREAIATLRTGYATRLDAMGRYVPISELDYWMAQTFAQAGERDSARTYAAYVTRAWRDADPEVRRLLEGLP